MPRLAAIAVLLAGAALTPASAAAPARAPGPDKRAGSPAFQPIRSFVLQYFSRLPDFRKGDLISQGQVRPLLEHLTGLGLAVPDPKDFLARVPAEDSFLVRQLRTRQGRKFMRHLSGVPGVYDRLERLAAMKRGRKTIVELIGRGKKGAAVIVYFADEQDGQKMGRLMARRGQSPDFNKSTGKIYTVDQLLDELENLYRQTEQAARKGKSPGDAGHAHQRDGKGKPGR